MYLCLCQSTFRLLENATDTFSYHVAGLSPYTKYSFRVVVSHTQGQTVGPWATLITAEDSKYTCSLSLYRTGTRAHVRLTTVTYLLMLSCTHRHKQCKTAQSKRHNVLQLWWLFGQISTLLLFYRPPVEILSFQMDFCCLDKYIQQSFVNDWEVGGLPPYTLNINRWPVLWKNSTCIVFFYFLKLSEFIL